MYGSYYRGGSVGYRPPPRWWLVANAVTDVLMQNPDIVGGVLSAGGSIIAKQVIDLVTPPRKRDYEGKPVGNPRKLEIDDVVMEDLPVVTTAPPPSAAPVHSVKKSRKMAGYGVYRGRFRRRGGRVRMSRPLTLGYQETFQGGGVETKANGVEMGHAYPLARLLKCWCAAALRLCFKNAGIEMNSWDSPVPFPGTLNLRLIVRGGYDGAPLSYAVPLPGVAPTYNDMANKMVEVIRGFDNDFLIFQILINNENGTSDYASETTVEDSVFCMTYTSILTLQNRTQPVAESNNTEDVRANPLVIKKFSGSGNGLIPRGTDFGPVYASADVGYIQGGLSDNVKGMNAAQAYKNCYNSYSTTLDPGCIKKDKLTFKFVGTTTKFMNALMNYISTNSSVTNVSRRCYLGRYSLFELERLCDTRSSEPDISVGFELVGLVQGYLKVKRKSYVNRRFEDLGTITPS